MIAPRSVSIACLFLPQNWQTIFLIYYKSPIFAYLSKCHKKKGKKEKMGGAKAENRIKMKEKKVKEGGKGGGEREKTNKQTGDQGLKLGPQHWKI